MAGVLVDHGLRDFLQRRAQANLRQIFGYVPHFGHKLVGASGKLRIALKEIVIFLQVRSTAGGIGDNGVVIAIEENSYIVSRQLSRLVPEAGVGMQGAATSLSCGDVYLNAVLHQGVYGGAVEMRKRDIVNASGKKSYL